MKIQIESYNEKMKSLEEGLSKNNSLKEQFSKFDEDYNILKKKEEITKPMKFWNIKISEITMKN